MKGFIEVVTRNRYDTLVYLDGFRALIKCKENAGCVLCFRDGGNVEIYNKYEEVKHNIEEAL
jgi:hypothetical protein